MHISENVHRSKRFLKTMPYKGTINVLSNLHLTLGTEKKAKKKNLKGSSVPLIWFQLSFSSSENTIDVVTNIDRLFYRQQSPCTYNSRCYKYYKYCFQNLSNLHFMIFELDRKSHAFNILA